MNITVILNAHHEGRLMHHTVRALNRSVQYARGKHLSVEVIVVADRPDQPTTDYIHQVMPEYFEGPYHVEVVDYGDLGSSRNHGVGVAKGKYIAFLDADNLFSENWLEKSYQFLKNHDEEIVVHPEYIVTFEGKTAIWRQLNSTSKEFNPYILVEHNYWDSVCMTRKEVLKRIPYAVTRAGEGFGPEDWLWNSETLNEGIHHYVVPGTVYFYRVKLEGSLLSAHEASGALLPPTPLLRPEFVRKYVGKKPAPAIIKDEPVHDSTVSKSVFSFIARAGRFGTYKLARISRHIGKIHPRLAVFDSMTQDALRELFRAPQKRGSITHDKLKVIDTLPKWLISEWAHMNQIDENLFPYEHVLSDMEEYRITHSNFTSVYWDIASQLGTPDYLFIVPWMKRGGAEKVILNYLRAIKEQEPHAEITVVATEGSDSPWANRIPKGVRFVTLDRYYHALDSDSIKERLLATLCVQLSPRVIHLVNAPIGFRMMAHYGKAISKYSRIFTSVFCVDQLPNGTKAHITLDYLQKIIDFNTKVFTDNASVIKEFSDLQALPIDKFSVHYQPAEAFGLQEKQFQKFTEENPLRVLWAGRFDVQKRPDILVAIAEKAKKMRLPVLFTAYGSPVLDSSDSGDMIAASESVYYAGGFNKPINRLDTQNYDLFLMTSQWEGMPNTPLEAIAGGLPVIAPSVGGIPELIRKNTGYLVRDYKNIDEYISYLKKITNDPRELSKIRTDAYKLVTSRHSWNSFVEVLQKEEGYLKMADYIPPVGQTPINPRLLGGPARFDLGAKTLFARSIIDHNTSMWPEEVYKAHLQAWNNFYEQAPLKEKYEDFRSAFVSIIARMQKKTFVAEDYPVVILPTGHLENGAHRFSAAVTVGQRINAIVNPDAPYTNWNYEYFRDRAVADGGEGLDEKYMDAMTIEHASQFPKNLKVVIIFPAALGFRAEAHETISQWGEILNYKEIPKDDLDSWAVTRHLYMGEEWCNDDHQVSVDFKSSHTFASDENLVVYIVKTSLSDDDLRKEKVSLRKKWGIGNDSIHMTDTNEEVQRLIRAFFHSGSRRILGLKKERNLPENFSRMFDRFLTMMPEDPFDRDDIAIDSSGTLAALGIRDANDIDYLHRAQEVPIFDDEGEVVSHNDYAHWYSESIDEMLSNPEKHFFYQGVKFVSLEMVYKMKQKRNETKDQEDIKRINAFLKQNPAFDFDRG